MKKKNEFQWLPEHQEAMEKVKNLLTSPPMRQHFNPALPTIIECDAAKRKGMGYALMQKHGEHYKLVEADSRWLTAAEQNYGMTSLELAGVYWAVEKCKLYLLGLESFEIITDHQALVSILNTKTLDEIENPRQQNMKEKLQQRFNFTVKWKQGKKMFISDALSRSPVSDPPEDNGVGEAEEPNERKIVNAINSKASDHAKLDEFGDMNLKKLLETTKADRDYQKLIKLVQNGCNRKMEMPEKLKDFWTSLDQLSICNGFVLLNRKRIVIPEAAKQEIL